MGRMARSCLQSILKIVNSGIGMVGMAMILYSLWMFRVWQRQMAPEAPAPWFIYSFLGLGLTLCFVTCSGHIAAETANGCCLCFYTMFVFLLIMIEAAVTMDVLLNRNWEDDFPDDPSGNFNELKDFIKQNFEICRWVGVIVVAIQGLSVLLAMILKALGPHRERYYESDDDYSPDRVPLLKHYAPQPSYVVGDPLHPSKSDAWNIRINSKQEKLLFLKDGEATVCASSGTGQGISMVKLGQGITIYVWKELVMVVIGNCFITFLSVYIHGFVSNGWNWNLASCKYVSNNIEICIGRLSLVPESLTEVPFCNLYPIELG
ncbi:OLC1v1024003C1 [Oldenlandia corymbosa var. corymbosa]|uniref:OLC1v1024003C1 n=1 Tax=Oldenlandia corymbosa var. corymbosa TaxID=529605 RepID=A0AAV1C1P2_OLDCO|nr:OLC1v1024003C1 [Oldenlandia corymbosa var. corymbosa]